MLLFVDDVACRAAGLSHLAYSNMILLAASSKWSQDQFLFISEQKISVINAELGAYVGLTMKFVCPLIAVSDLEASKKFYQQVLNQKVALDLGWNVWFSGGFAIQLNFADIVSIDKETVKTKSHNFELYFEEDDFDSFIEKLKSFDDIEYVHLPKKHEWQQRVVRIYDPDKHIIEVGESMSVIAKRYLNQGYTVEETAKIIQHPVEFVKNVLAKNP